MSTSPSWPADAYVFDLDGTLVDSARDIQGCASATLFFYGRRPISRAQTVRFIGDGARMFLSRAFAATGEPLDESALDEALAHFLQVYAQTPSQHTRPFPGVVEVLDTLRQRGLPMAVCTNKPEGIARELLEHLGLMDHFRTVVGGDSLPVRKPDPAPVLAALRSLGPVQAPWFVGDSPTDRAAAANAGLPCILVRWGYTRVPVDRLGAERVVDDLSSLIGPGSWSSGCDARR